MNAAASVAVGPLAKRVARWVGVGLAAAVLLPVVVVVAVIAPIDRAAHSANCPDLVGQPGDPIGATTGNLGGVAGTGISRSELRIVRGDRGSSITPGAYLSTSYGPPWGGIQGPGLSTAGGLRLNGGAPPKYLVAVDPALVALGSWLYAWPNPFDWQGPFLAADTGGAIRGRRIDFYDWRGRVTQSAWGRVPVQVSARPQRVDTGATSIAPRSMRTLAAALPDSSCSLAGVRVSGSGSGRDAVKLALTFVGRSARRTRFAGFSPPSVQYAWCAWFVTNLWRRAGVPIAVNAYSGYPYQWAAAAHHDLILKAPGTEAKTLRLPVGTALMYGRGPGSSVHINLVRATNPDGTIEVIGGNQGAYPGHVTTYGPCRLTNGTFVRSSCDRRPIWGIVVPSADESVAA